MLFEDSILVFWLVSHSLQYQFGYDDNRFLDKPYLQVISLVSHIKSFGFIVESTTFVAL
jgi:hypothetical protein